MVFQGTYERFSAHCQLCGDVAVLDVLRLDRIGEDSYLGLVS